MAMPVERLNRLMRVKALFFRRDLQVVLKKLDSIGKIVPMNIGILFYECRDACVKFYGRIVSLR